MKVVVITDEKLTWFDETSFNTTDWDCSNTTDFVDILEWESKWFVGWTAWWDDGVEGPNINLNEQ